MSNIRVLYDGSAFDMQTHGGVSRCFAQLVKCMPAGIEATISVRNTENVYLKAMGFASRQHIVKRMVEAVPLVGKKMVDAARRQWPFDKLITWQHVPENRRYCIELLKEGQFDIFHPTFFDDYFLPYIGKKPMVMTVHDLIPERFPQYYPKNFKQVRQMQRMLPLAAHIVAVSEHTKLDLMDLYNVPGEKITVVHHGIGDEPFTPSQRSALPYRYLLYVGERHYYKNFERLCRDLAALMHLHADLHIVCTGKPFTRDEQQMLQRLRLDDRVMQTFVENDNALLNLYHHAEAFIFPSSYEGFGLPILEAYKARVPVILNRASCFPEIAGDAAIYMDIGETQSTVAQAVDRVLAMTSDEREAILQRQDLRLGQYSWRKAAGRLADIYRQLSAQPPLPPC